MSLRAAALALAFAAVVHADTTHKPEPNPPLNAVPTDTSNPRLVGKAFDYNNLPEQADTSVAQPPVVFRGPQAGYNICNSTTEGPNSMCQTLIVNSIDDFCFWAPSTMKSIGDSEGEEVAWCIKPGHGARLVPEGTFTGLQFIKTPSYIEITGELDQTKVNILAGDGGGELDSGGQDNRGNPIGGLVYSNNLPSSNGKIIQSRTWHMFIGNNKMCMKFCDPTAPDALGLCQHIYDTIGCTYNVPASYQDGAFLSCQGEDQDPVGIFTGADGQVTTYQNEGEGVVPHPPYTPRIPVSSNCQTLSSAQIFSVSTSTTTTTTSTSAGVTGGSGGTTSGSKAGSTPTGAAARRVGISQAAVLAVLLPAAAMLIGAAIIA